MSRDESGFSEFIGPIIGPLLALALRASPAVWWRSWLLSLVALLARLLLPVYRLVEGLRSLER